MEYAIYDLDHNQQLLGIFETYKQAGEYLRLSADAVQKAIKRKSIMKDRYIARKIKEGE